MSAWFDEIDLDPGSTWRRMGTRALGTRPWLVTDDRTAHELALRRELFQGARDEVFVPAPTPVGDDVLRLVREATDRRPGGRHTTADDPLAEAGLSVQEDLCLLQRSEDGWHLDAAFVCFPSRWRLADKIGRPLVDVHGPTDGYVEHLAPRVDRMLDRLTDRPVLRRNWFVHPDPALHQPTAPATDPVVPAARALDHLYLRSERQTLRMLASGWVLFTIRVQQDSLAAVFDNSVSDDSVSDDAASRRQRFSTYVEQASTADLAHRGVGPEQLVELRIALGITAAGAKSDTTSDL